MSFDSYHNPPKVRQLIIDNYNQGMSKKDIKKIFNVSTTSINAYIERYESTNTILSEHEMKQQSSNDDNERIKILDDAEYKEYLLDSCILNPTRSLNDHVDHFYNNFGFYIGRNTINRLFIKNNITWKRLSKIAIESDPEEEALFFRCYEALVCDPKQPLWIDESMRNDKTANPTYGRGKGFVIVYHTFVYITIFLFCCT